MLETLLAKLKNPRVLVLLSFLIGCVLFFPLDRIQGKLLESLRGSGIRMTMGPMHLSRGIFPEGGLLGFEAQGMQAVVGMGTSIECDEVKISPQVWRLLILRFQIAISCKRKSAGTLLAVVQSGNLFSPSKMTVSMDLNDVDLEVFGSGAGINGLKGVANGSLAIGELSNFGPNHIDVDLDLEKLKTPAFSEPSTGASLPSLELETGEIRLTIDKGRYDLKRILLGKEKGSFFVDLKGDLVKTPDMMFPKGILAGRVKVDPDLEKTELKDLKLDLYFGKIKDSGFREFKRKELNGSPISLLNPPQE
jgi:type II secretion system protein N